MQFRLTFIKFHTVNITETLESHRTQTSAHPVLSSKNLVNSATTTISIAPAFVASVHISHMSVFANGNAHHGKSAELRLGIHTIHWPLTYQNSRVPYEIHHDGGIALAIRVSRRPLRLNQI